tara:strand:+ start:163 stop:483 length:321 start_codon:yes stop_codon:yes gene_type:complete
MNDFNKILEQAKLLQEKVKDSQEQIKKIEVEGVSGGNAVKIKLDGDGEIIKIDLSLDIMKEKKEIVEDLIVAAHFDAKKKLKLKTSDELSRITGGVSLPPGFKWPF